MVGTKDSGHEHIVFFGDSISFGQLVSPHRVWTTRLSAAIEAAHGDRFLVVNTSINGNTTRMALERMPHDVQCYHLDVLVIQFGMNDCNIWRTDCGLPRVSPEAYAANLTEMVRRGRVFGARRVLLMTSPPTPQTERLYEKNRRHYAAIMREVAQQTECGLIDIETMMKDRPLDYLMADGIHLNHLGHDLFVAMAGPVLMDCLADLPRREA